MADFLSSYEPSPVNTAYVNLLSGVEAFSPVRHSSENDVLPWSSSVSRKQVSAGASAQTTVVGKILDSVIAFVNECHLTNGMISTNVNKGAPVGPTESFSAHIEPNNIDGNKIANLIKSCGIPEMHHERATRVVMNTLARYIANRGESAGIRMSHYLTTDNSTLKQEVDKTMQSMYHPAVLAEFNRNAGEPGMEAFGANIDTVASDIRVSLAVDLLAFHRSLTDRAMPRQTHTSPYVIYNQSYTEVYDMFKAMAKDAQTRNEGDHITPFINLYTDPKMVSVELTPVVPVLERDSDPTNPQLHADGVVLNNKTVNLFDLSMIPTKTGFTHIDQTDLLSEGVIFDSVYVEVSKGGVKETFQFVVNREQQAKYFISPNGIDSGDRVLLFPYLARVDKYLKQFNGTDTVIFKDATIDDYVKFRFNISSTINLKTAELQTSIVVTPEVGSTGAVLSADLQTLIDGDFKVSILGYSVDARYSEENLRKTNLALRSNRRQYYFEISQGRNIVYDYSLQETLPESALAMMTEVNSLGVDHRTINIAVQQLGLVFQRNQQENADPNFNRRRERLAHQYLSGQQVNPTAIMGKIDLNEVDSLKSGEYLGDVRGKVQQQLLLYISQLHQVSQYRYQLGTETPTYTVITSPIVMENLFQIEHYHNHLNKDPQVDGQNVEYRLVLPNGVILNCITCSFGYIRDKIIVIPTRPNKPDDVLNFGHYLDYGTFIAHYNPQYENSVYKRMFSNSRTTLIPTNPSGLYIQVFGLEELTRRVYEKTIDSKLYDPSSVIAEAVKRVNGDTP